MWRLAVAVSGSGRSLENFLHHQSGEEGYQVVAVIASRSDCRGVLIASAAGLPVFVDDFNASQLNKIGSKLYAWLDELDVDLVALAGFLKLFPLHPSWDKRVVNIHPALLPRFGGRGMYGDRVHNAVLSSGDKQTGATVHFVNERYDEGAKIAETIVPVLSGDDTKTLAARVFAAECELYPRVVKSLLQQFGRRQRT